jgi:DNA-binding phage protein
LSKILNGSDKDVVAHARDVVANSIMSEIAKEDPQGQAEYKDTVRHQVVATFQRIHVLLLILDMLMETYNASH